MSTKSNFSPSEWKQLISAPHHIYSILSQVDRESILMKRKEAKALNKFMKAYGSGTGLVQELIEDEKDADDSKETVADAYKELESIGDLIERKAPGSAGDAVRTFLVKAANEVAKAVSEERGLLKKGKDVSTKERTAINRIEASLKATSADARRRRTASAESSSGRRAATGAAAGAAAAAVKRKSASSGKSDAEKQKAAVAARAAARKAAKAKEADSASAVAAQKAAVAKRAADRKAAAAAEKAAADAAAREKAQKEAQRQRAVEAAERKREEAVAKAKAESKARMAKAAAAKAAAEVRTYTVKSGDTLSGISLQMYGTANKWKGIFEANGDQLKDPSLIYPGQVLKIPDQE